MNKLAPYTLGLLILALSGCSLLEDILSGQKEETESIEITTVSEEGTIETHQVSAQPEREPNNTTETATRLGFNRPISGSLLGEDIDTFMLAAGNEPVIFELIGEGSWELVAQQERSGATWHYTGTGRTTIGPVGRNENVFLSLTGEMESYLLQTNLHEEAMNSFLLEPDSAEQPGAHTDQLPFTIREQLSDQSDNDYFELSWSAITSVEVLSFELIPRSEQLSLQLELLDADNARVLLVHGEVNETIQIPNVRRPSAPGPLQIQIRASQPITHANYELRVQESLLSAEQIELEPNDSREQASHLTATTNITGYLHHANDVDFYVLSPETGPLSISVTPPVGVNASLVIDPGGIAPEIIDEGSAGENETFCALLPRSEPAFISVRGDQSSREPYLMTTSSLQTEHYEQEPNNSPSELSIQQTNVAISQSQLWTSLGANSTQQGHVFPAGDVDIFLLKISAENHNDTRFRHITLHLLPNDALNLLLSLSDTDGGQLGSANAGLVGEEERLEVDLPPGEYYLSVRGAENEQSCALPYSLSVTQVALPAFVEPIQRPTSINEAFRRPNEVQLPRLPQPGFRPK